MLNENLLAVLIVILALALTALGLDNGDLVKSVVAAYLGFLIGKRR